MSHKEREYHASRVEPDGGSVPLDKSQIPNTLSEPKQESLTKTGESTTKIGVKAKSVESTTQKEPDEQSVPSIVIREYHLDRAMIWIAVAYLTVGYIYFHLVLRNLQCYDGPDTAILNGVMSILVGPLLITPILIYSFLNRSARYIESTMRLELQIKARICQSTTLVEPPTTSVPSAASHKS